MSQQMEKPIDKLTYYRKEPFYYIKLGDFYICPYGCLDAYSEKKSDIKKHLLSHSDEELV